MKVKQIRYGLGYDLYEVSCGVCGGSVRTWQPKPNVVYKCAECKQKEKELRNESAAPLRQLKAERRLEIAVNHLEAKGLLEQYSKALDIVNKHLYKTNWFESSDEILVALELIRCGYKFRHQVKLGRWRIDFMIPDLKVVLEVDGSLFHAKEHREKDRRRDNAIIAYLGPDWEVVRISDRVLEMNIQKLVPAIKKVVDERKRVRRNFNYKLPDWYSDKHI